MCKFNEDEIIKYANDIINATFIEATLQDKDGNIIEQGLVNKDVIKGLLDLYQKEKEKNASLQKEIEKYKKVIDNRDFTWKQKYEETFEYVNKEFISKDKIREKIKEYKGLKEIDKMAYEEQIKPLQELLEEE